MSSPESELPGEQWAASARQHGSVRCRHVIISHAVEDLDTHCGQRQEHPDPSSGAPADWWEDGAQQYNRMEHSTSGAQRCSVSTIMLLCWPDPTSPKHAPSQISVRRSHPPLAASVASSLQYHGIIMALTTEGTHSRHQACRSGCTPAAAAAHLHQCQVLKDWWELATWGPL
jgi:hypothetical protein